MTDSASLVFLNQRIDNRPRGEVLDWVREAPGRDGFSYVVTPNVDHLLKLVENRASEAQASYPDADLVVCDSRIVELLAGLVGKRVRVYPGSDLVGDLLGSSPGRYRTVAVVGPGERDVEILGRRFPQWSFVRIHAPMMEIGSREFEELGRTVAEAQWDYLLICLGFPKQEALAGLLRRLGRCSGVALCVGASIDFLVGTQVRAPDFIQRARLEWVHRLFTNPRRLWRRYVLEGPRILYWYLKIEVLGPRRTAPPDA